MLLHTRPSDCSERLFAWMSNHGCTQPWPVFTPSSQRAIAPLGQGERGDRPIGHHLRDLMGGARLRLRYPYPWPDYGVDRHRSRVRLRNGPRSYRCWLIHFARRIVVVHGISRYNECDRPDSSRGGFVRVRIRPARLRLGQVLGSPEGDADAVRNQGKMFYNHAIHSQG
jgi:hypothetical protein